MYTLIKKSTNIIQSLTDPANQCLKLVSTIFKRQMYFFVISNEVH